MSETTHHGLLVGSVVVSLVAAGWDAAKHGAWGSFVLTLAGAVMMVGAHLYEAAAWFEWPGLLLMMAALPVRWVGRRTAGAR